MTQKKTPEAKPAPEKPKPVILLLLKPLDGLVAGRVVTADTTRADQLIKAKHAQKATKQQISLAGSRIPHIH